MVNSAFNVVLPLVVIHFAAKEVWGEFVSVLLFILIAAACNNFGNKEQLLRQISDQPRNIRQYFTENFYARMPILLVSILIGLFVFPFPFACFIGLSLLGLYVIQSFEAIIVFEKKFRFSALVEMIFGILFIAILLFFKDKITAFLILKLYTGLQLIKVMVYGYAFLNFFEKRPSRFTFDFFKKSFPFFLLTLMGFLASKNDVYLVHFFLSKSKLAEYQILNNLCLFAMGIAGFLYIPFTKNIYRNSKKVIGNLKRVLLILGFIVTIVAVIIIYLVLRLYLKIQVPYYFHLIVFGYIFPSFIYGIEIITLYKDHREMKVVKYLFIGIIINVVVSASLLYSGFDIVGALLGSAIAQLVVLGLFISERKRNFSKMTSDK